ncbi:hypothetical protein HK405_011961, partial [Cladochytrium tenue]
MTVHSRIHPEGSQRSHIIPSQLLDAVKDQPILEPQQYQDTTGPHAVRPISGTFLDQAVERAFQLQLAHRILASTNIMYLVSSASLAVLAAICAGMFVASGRPAADMALPVAFLVLSAVTLLVIYVTYRAWPNYIAERMQYYPVYVCTAGMLFYIINQGLTEASLGSFSEFDPAISEVTYASIFAICVVLHT